MRNIRLPEVLTETQRTESRALATEQLVLYSETPQVLRRFWARQWIEAMCPTKDRESSMDFGLGAGLG